jgi:hypothetical protein
LGWKHGGASRLDGRRGGAQLLWRLGRGPRRNETNGFGPSSKQIHRGSLVNYQNPSVGFTTARAHQRNPPKPPTRAPSQRRRCRRARAILIYRPAARPSCSDGDGFFGAQVRRPRAPTVHPAGLLSPLGRFRYRRSPLSQQGKPPPFLSLSVSSSIWQAKVLRT